MGEPQLVRKVEFAAICGVTKGRVMQWIAEGKIKPDAIVGEGRGARINVELAAAQVEEGSNASQRYSTNGLSTRLSRETRPKAATATKLAAAKLATPKLEVAKLEAAPVEDTVEGLLKREKPRQAQLQTLRAEKEERKERGLLTDTAAARGEATRRTVEQLNQFESIVRDLASVAAGKFGVSGRDMLHLMQTEYKRLRAGIAENYRDSAKKKPKTTDDDLDLPGDIQ